MFNTEWRPLDPSEIEALSQIAQKEDQDAESRLRTMWSNRGLRLIHENTIASSGGKVSGDAR